MTRFWPGRLSSALLILLAALGGAGVHAQEGEKPKLAGLTLMETMDDHHFKYHYQPDEDKDPVVGFIALPKRNGPFRVVIAQHSTNGNAKQVAYNYAPQFVDRGYAVITLELKFASKPEESQWDEILRRTKACFDIIEHDERLDAGQVFMFGNASGAMVTLAFAAHSDKLKGIALTGSGMIPKDGVDYAKISAPVILIHGAKDESVPLELAQKLKSNLEKAGKTVELKVFENYGHEVITMKSADVYDAIVAFFNRQSK